jgi:hypothetical protein
MTGLILLKNYMKSKGKKTTGCGMVRLLFNNERKQHNPGKRETK